MKKTLIFLLVAALLLPTLFTGCKDKKPEETTHEEIILMMMGEKA